MNIVNDSGNDIARDLEVNCLYYGCNFLIKLDNVNIIQAQFEKFEKRFRNNEKSHYDLKLPLFIIDCFSKLWKLWSDMPDLRELIDESKFRNVFSDMLPFFSGKDPTKSSVTESKLFCNICNDKIELVNNDFYFSYDLHIQTPRHVEAVTKSNSDCLRTSGSEKLCAVDNADNSIHNSSISRMKSSSSCWSYDSTATPVVSPTSDLVSNSRKFTSVGASLLNLDMKSETKPFVPPQRLQVSASLPSLNTSSQVQSLDFKLPTEVDPYCGACCRSISVNPTVIHEHVKGQSHQKQVQLMKKCVLLLKTQQRHISLLDRKSFQFNCKLCNKTQMGTNCLQQHCKSNEHVSKLKEVAKNTKK